LREICFALTLYFYFALLLVCILRRLLCSFFFRTKELVSDNNPLALKGDFLPWVHVPKMIDYILEVVKGFSWLKWQLSQEMSFFWIIFPLQLLCTCLSALRLTLSLPYTYLKLVLQLCYSDNFISISLGLWSHHVLCFDLVIYHVLT